MLNHVFNVSGGGGKEMKIRVDGEHFERFQTEKAVYKSIIILIITKKIFWQGTFITSSGFQSGPVKMEINK